MSRKFLLIVMFSAFLAACQSMPQPSGEPGELRYGKITKMEYATGGTSNQRITVVLKDGTVVETTQPRDPTLAVGDVVRVLGKGATVQVIRL